MASATAFPQNIVELLAERLALVPGVRSVVTRDLDPGDGNGTVGVWASDWEPIDHEMPVPEPMGRYTFHIQTINKYAAVADGRAASSVLAKSIRVMLYRDPDLQVRLRQLSETSVGWRESGTRYGVSSQRYIDGQYLGEHLFLTISEAWLETRIEAQ